jgi:ubiquinone/menaquinone biosynthesis C-methylase UbiE
MLVLTAKKGLHCVGLDLSKKHLNSAKERLDRLQIRERVSLVLGSAQHLPFRFDAFDLIILSEVLEHLLNPQECIIEARSVTRRGGVLILTTINAARITLSINPIVWIEAVIGQHFSKALSYRSLVIHPENPLIHRDFTADELRNLFQGADFSVLEISSLGFSIFYQVSYFVGPSLNVFTGLAKIIERIGAKMPVVKNLGYHFCVVCRRA